MESSAVLVGLGSSQRVLSPLHIDAVPKSGSRAILLRESRRKPAGSLRAEDVVRGYRNPSEVERVLRGLKGIDLGVRPIRRHKEETVRGHIFLCLSADYVERPLRAELIEDEESAGDRRRSDPPRAARISREGRRKKALHGGEGGFVLHGFKTLSAEARPARSTCAT